MYFEIITNRLVLKPLGKKYLQTTIQYAMDYENTKYMCYMPKDTVDETEAFLESIDVEWEKDTPEFYEFAIIFNRCHIGAVSIYFENGIGELGWIINKKYWNNGFAYEAANSLIQYAKNELGVKHFVSYCDTENIASYKVMERLGMIKTEERSGRKNRCSINTSKEYRYELLIQTTLSLSS